MSRTADDRFAELVTALEAHPGVTPPGASGARTSGTRKFGAEALKVGGKIFAMLVDGRLVVKLPKSRVEVLALAGHGVHFDPGHGRLMKEWLHVDAGSELDWMVLASEALGYVAGAGRSRAAGTP